MLVKTIWCFREIFIECIFEHGLCTIFKDNAYFVAIYDDNGIRRCHKRDGQKIQYADIYPDFPPTLTN